MPLYTTLRFEVRAEAREEAERAMHEFASYVRGELEDSSFTIYRDPQSPTHYLAFVRATTPGADERHRGAVGTQAFMAALTPLLVGTIDERPCELVTSSDLAPRRRPEGRRRAR
jgi:quinol monooxygenase YgiN